LAFLKSFRLHEFASALVGMVNDRAILMSKQPVSVADVAQLVRVALGAGDLVSFSEVLDPDVHWGSPGDASPPCRTRGQVIAWYKKASSSEARARVTEVVLLGDQILIGMEMQLARSSSRRMDASQTLRWQLLAVRDGRIIDIVGFDERSDGIAYAKDRLD
jgi:ketosteroid isomerase-like protein